MPVFERDGLAFDYLDEGDPWGAPLRLPARGLGGDVSQPAGVFSPLLGNRLLSLDCRGHGETYPLGGAQKLPFSPFADDLAALDLENNAVGVTTPDGGYRVLAKDDKRLI